MAEAPERYCRDCGHESSLEDQLCPNCGRPGHLTARVPTPEADVRVPPLATIGDPSEKADYGEPEKRSLSTVANNLGMSRSTFLLRPTEIPTASSAPSLI